MVRSPWGKGFAATVITGMAGLLVAASCDENRTAQAASTPANAQAAPVDREVSMAKAAAAPEVFKPQVAGRFYDANPGKLRAEIEGYLAEAAKKEKRVDGDLLGIIVPHAGYPYSGPVAAHAFGLLEGRGYKRVVVLGPAHQRAYPVPALLSAGAYRTPLGDIPIDTAGVAKLAGTGAAKVDDEKFADEHALEVELPFLQVAIGAGFELVPIMVSRLDRESASKLARALAAAFPGRDTLYVASTDLSHDYPYEVAVAMDENAMRYVTALDPAGLVAAERAFRRAGRDIRLGQQGKPEPDCAQLCGLGTVLTLLELAKLHTGAAATLLDRRTSGDIVGDKGSRIVGYAAVAVSLSTPRPEAKAAESSSAGGEYLNEPEKQALLKIARDALEAHLADGSTPDFSPALEKLEQPGAAFVTLKNHGRLRGCIGYMEPIDPLWKMIRDRAIDAATHDTRFSPVTEEELSDLTIEISVLTPRVPVKNPLEEIQIGRDGVWLELGRHRGVFLPQVPVEQGWDTVENYLDNLCRKAHIIERGCWKSPEARIQRFTALVFSEAEE